MVGIHLLHLVFWSIRMCEDVSLNAMDSSQESALMRKSGLSNLGVRKSFGVLWCWWIGSEEEFDEELMRGRKLRELVKGVGKDHGRHNVTM